MQPNSIVYLAFNPPHDGPVCIMQVYDGADVQQCLDKFATAHGWKPEKVRQIKAEDIPSARTFRNAWRMKGASIMHDMDAVRATHRDNIRRIRAPVFADLDVKFARALEKQDNESERQAIVYHKQLLRDLPQNPEIDTAATPQAIVDLWPAHLSNPYVPPPVIKQPTLIQRMRRRLGI
ncbi:MAG: hypothetical protein ACREUY_01215 [Burkholderiales bacterium]